MPGSSTPWVVLTTVASVWEADVLVAVLGAAGIPARASGNDVTAIFGPGFIGATPRGVSVLVPADAEDEARAVVAEGERADDALGEPEAPNDGAA